VADVRTAILSKQGFKCAICGCPLRNKVRGGAALDHCHESGVIRGVLCVSCNGGEGKVKSAAIRYGGGLEKWEQWLRNMLAYLSIHKIPKTNFIHPTFMTDDEKRLKRNKTARIKRNTANANTV